MKSKLSVALSSLALTASLPFATAHAGDEHAGKRDFGKTIEHLLNAQSKQLFGIKKPLDESAPETTEPVRAEGQPASSQLLVAKRLKVDFLTRDAADQTDMMVFWPNDEHPTHLFTAVEVFSPATTTDGKPHPFVQRIDLSTGQVDVVLRGGLGGDPIRRTPWGTLIVGEEVADGAVYEIIDPVMVTEAVITNRAIGSNTDPSHVAKRPDLGLKSWEGIGVLASGVLYSGDELRPGDAGADKDGGAIFKFVPGNPNAGVGPITDLSQSPLVSGSLYAMQVSSLEVPSSNFPRYGQGSEVGAGAWVKVDPTIARSDAAAKGATGYYRPEDLELDPDYDGVRFCWTNTQREAAESYAEVMCAVDHHPESAGETLKNGLTYLADASSGNLATFSVSRFIEGNPDFNSFDNLAFQPGTGNLFVVEDHDNGDVWSCLPDGDDKDLKSDGCIKVMSVIDSEAEPSGLFFSKDGKTAYLSIMHSNDANMPLNNGWPTDDILVIKGFTVQKHGDH